MSHRVRAPPFTVLGNDDLLREILLLRAALVCKRWYRHASDPDFLRQFRERHPPRILSVYLNTVGRPRPRFFPIRPLPELAAAASRAGSFFDAFADSTFIHQSRWGRLLVRIPDEGHHYLNSTLLSCSPLSIAGNAVVIPPSPPQPLLQQPGLQLESCCVSLPDGGDGGSYLCVVMVAREQQIDVNLYELQDMCWVTRASAAAQLNIFHSDDAGNWFLEDSICLREVRANLGMVDWLFLDGYSHGVKIYAVGDNAKFVFLEMFGTIVLLDITTAH
ncbi:hypothetical protein PR202_ga07265 [Eleusine coracana subsp. coracana]|uniref:F-box protein AT5G49610-like beta-propeller domain-containing protein n=1 Tax=Eleusine coracana subsp. coracana TaxID=191504 RepID=A0AAV5BZH3_ELECO|nr:hypothetical protein PR202_ga07265 [Eleusine coracana subsp. coracana]